MMTEQYSTINLYTNGNTAYRTKVPYAVFFRNNDLLIYNRLIISGI